MELKTKCVSNKRLTSSQHKIIKIAINIHLLCARLVLNVPYLLIHLVLTKPLFSDEETEHKMVKHLA